VKLLKIILYAYMSIGLDSDGCTIQFKLGKSWPLIKMDCYEIGENNAILLYRRNCK